MPIIPFGETESSEVSLVVEARKEGWGEALYCLFGLTYNIFLLKKGLKYWIQWFYACETSAGECSLSSQELLSPTSRTRDGSDVFTVWWFREIEDILTKSCILLNLRCQLSKVRRIYPYRELVGRDGMAAWRSWWELGEELKGGAWCQWQIWAFLLLMSLSWHRSFPWLCPRHLLTAWCSSPPGSDNNSGWKGPLEHVRWNEVAQGIGQWSLESPGMTNAPPTYILCLFSPEFVHVSLSSRDLWGSTGGSKVIWRKSRLYLVTLFHRISWVRRDPQIQLLFVFYSV